MLALALVACAQEYPNTTFQPNSEYGRAIDFLWDRLLLFGTIAFVLVETLLVVVVFKYRRRDETTVPPQVHGNTQIEILWTLIPAVILVFIAVPTVRTIFETQAKAPANAVEIEVYGHQWWWEFKYPQYGFSTANEVYIPAGRTVNFVLRSKDVVHSFWVPQLAGKRDVIPNRTNYIWFTPDSVVPTTVWNGFCTEYCGASHANMRFRVVTVQPTEFEGWVRHQLAPAFYSSASTAPTPATSAEVSASTTAIVSALETSQSAEGPTLNEQPVISGSPTGATTTAAVATTGAYYTLPASQVPAYAVPTGHVPSSIKFDDKLIGDPASGEKLFTGAGTCNACHFVKGNPLAVGVIGPDLTHVGTRISLAGGMFKNDAVHLARWIKNARLMKPGSLMPTLGKGEYDPHMKSKMKAGLTDQQIADLVAYLAALK